MPPSTVATAPRHVDVRRVLRPIEAFLLRFQPLADYGKVPVAIFEDMPNILAMYLKEFSRLKGIDIRTRAPFEHPDEALVYFRRSRPPIVITDLSLTPHANLDGFTILRFIKAEAPETAVALSTSYSPVQRGGLHDRIMEQPFDAVFNKIDFKGMGRFMTERAGEFRRHGPAPPDLITGRN